MAQSEIAAALAYWSGDRQVARRRVEGATTPAQHQREVDGLRVSAVVGDVAGQIHGAAVEDECAVPALNIMPSDCIPPEKSFVLLKPVEPLKHKNALAAVDTPPQLAALLHAVSGAPPPDQMPGCLPE